LWTAEFHFLGRRYPYIVNGRTGDIFGKRPWSAWKITAVVVLSLLLLIVVWLVLGGLDSAFDGMTRGF
jgi:hypothetical protein